MVLLTSLMHFHRIAWLGVGDGVLSLIPALAERALRRIMSWVYEHEFNGWQGSGVCSSGR